MNILLSILWVLFIGLVVGILVSSRFPLSDGKLEEYEEEPKEEV